MVERNKVHLLKLILLSYLYFTRVSPFPANNEDDHVYHNIYQILRGVYSGTIHMGDFHWGAVAQWVEQVD